MKRPGRMSKFEIKYSEDFCYKYISKIPKDHQKRIRNFIENRIASDPYYAGEPLRGEFLGLFRSRCGEYRIIYQILKEEVVVIVIKIGHRKDIYK